MKSEKLKTKKEYSSIMEVSITGFIKEFEAQILSDLNVEHKIFTKRMHNTQLTTNTH